jgi:pimeloyl-ACP methyl ester carboxylesterase
MAFFETETGTIYYEIHGTGGPATQTLTLLHNFMSSGRSAWGPMLGALSKHFRVVLPDLPGHARSQGYPKGFDHHQMAGQLAALMRAEEAVTGHLAGVSGGGMMALLMVHADLVQPTTLTLVSTTYSNNSATTGIERAVSAENFRAGRRWLEATARLHDPHHYEGYFDEVLLGDFRNISADQTIDLNLEDLADWAMPISIIHGGEDEFFPPQIAEDMGEVLPNAEVHIIADQPHALIFRRPWAVQEIMMDFLLRYTPERDRG